MNSQLSHRSICRWIWLAAVLLALTAIFARYPYEPALAGERLKPPGGPPADPAIAFIQKAGANDKLVVMNADGSNATAIYRCPTNCNLPYGPSWSPDGQSIAFGKNYDVWVIDVVLVQGVPTGTNLRLLVDASLADPAWSPDPVADEVLFVELIGDAIEVIPASGGTPQVIYQSPPGVYPHHPAWSPDGQFIAFAEFNYDVNAYQIQILERWTGIVTTVPTPFAEFPRYLDWSRSGTDDILTFDDHQGGICTMDLSTGVVTSIASGSCPTWSPDDSKIAFTNPNGRIAFVTLATGQVQALRQSGSMADWRRF